MILFYYSSSVSLCWFTWFPGFSVWGECAYVHSEQIWEAGSKQRCGFGGLRSCCDSWDDFQRLRNSRNRSCERSMKVETDRGGTLWRTKATSVTLLRMVIKVHKNRYLSRSSLLTFTSLPATNKDDPHSCSVLELTVTTFYNQTEAKICSMKTNVDSLINRISRRNTEKVPVCQIKQLINTDATAQVKTQTGPF